MRKRIYVEIEKTAVKELEKCATLPTDECKRLTSVWFEALHYSLVSRQIPIEPIEYLFTPYIWYMGKIN